MIYIESIQEIITRRFSCRTYRDDPISPELQFQLTEEMGRHLVGPLGSKLRITLTAASSENRTELRGLGTYGFIRGASAFLIGAVMPGPKNFEDYGYIVEQFVLKATELHLGTCWLGGSFTRSSFAHKINLTKEEKMPAVVSLGYMGDPNQSRQTDLRKRIGSDNRLDWSDLFFDGDLRLPLTAENSGVYAPALEMVRIGPSASNKQPWRIVKDRNLWHFYLQRTPGYRSNVFASFLGSLDSQRIDMGIAMCHFELTAHELGLRGEWTIQEPAIEELDELTEYTITWKSF
jgi:nitroreductase